MYEGDVSVISDTITHYFFFGSSMNKIDNERLLAFAGNLFFFREFTRYKDGQNSLEICRSKQNNKKNYLKDAISLAGIKKNMYFCKCFYVISECNS